MAVDVFLLNTSVLDIRSPDFTFTDARVGPGGLAVCPTAQMPDYTQEQLAGYVERGLATAGGSGNTAPLLAHAGVRVAVGSYLGAGSYGGLDIQGRTFYTILARNGVDLSATVIHPSLPTGTTFIHQRPAGERGGIAYFPNANNDFDFARFRGEVERLDPKIVYYMYSGLSERGDAHGGRDLAAFVRWCREHGRLTIVDSHTLCGNPQELIRSGASVRAYRLLEPLLGELDIFFTSVDEARMIRNTLEGEGTDHGEDVGVSIEGYLRFVASRFGRVGRPQLFGVTVKRGAYTLWLKGNGEVEPVRFTESRYSVDGVVDLVGAGDSFRAGVVGYIAHAREAFLDGTLRVEEAVQVGNLMATLYVTSPLENRYGAIPTLAQLIALVRTGDSYTDSAVLRRAVTALPAPCIEVSNRFREPAQSSIDSTPLKTVSFYKRGDYEGKKDEQENR